MSLDANEARLLGECRSFLFNPATDEYTDRAGKALPLPDQDALDRLISAGLIEDVAGRGGAPFPLVPTDAPAVSW